MQIGDRAVRTAFSATCALLAAAERTLFRRLGALPVREFPAWVAAALLNVDSDEGTLVLDRLAEVHLVEPRRAGHRRSALAHARVAPALRPGARRR
ncbi:MAG: hypothetical protein M3513_15530 [Actinomycetota bacterium]|nr:hypothetical protein [Actinomycetota bacterium]